MFSPISVYYPLSLVFTPGSGFTPGSVNYSLGLVISVYYLLVLVLLPCSGLYTLCLDFIPWVYYLPLFSWGLVFTPLVCLLPPGSGFYPLIWFLPPGSTIYPCFQGIRFLPGFWTNSWSAFCSRRTWRGLLAIPTNAMISRNSSSPASHSCCTSSPPTTNHKQHYITHQPINNQHTGIMRMEGINLADLSTQWHAICVKNTILKNAV